MFSAAGAGGVALQYWALRKAGMGRRRVLCREVAFLAILYSVYLLALVLFGVLLATQVLPGEDHLSVTIIPASIAGGVVVLLGQPRCCPATWSGACESLAGIGVSVAQRLASVPATLAQGVRTAIDHVRNRAWTRRPTPRRSASGRATS